MKMQLNRWHEEDVNPKLHLELDDLTTILTQIDTFQFAFTYGSFIDLERFRMTGSTFWAATQKDLQSSGYKTDLYLRAIGTLKYTDLSVLQPFYKNTKLMPYPDFSRQLFTLLEDLRLEEKIKQLRPGTRRDFIMRKNHLQEFFSSQLVIHTTRGYPLDELFCLVYLTLQADHPEPSFPHALERQITILEKIRTDLYESFAAETTYDIARIVEKITEKLISYDKDMRNVYFTWPIFKGRESYTYRSLFDELTRTDDVENDESETVDPQEKEYFDEKFSTWHRENKNTEQHETFLQMDLEMGTKTNLLGGEARETESGDQAFASAQGTSQTSDSQDYSERETLRQQERSQAGNKTSAPYGKENINAVPIFKESTPPTIKEKEIYQNYVRKIEPYRRRLTETIHNMLEYKRTNQRRNLLFGRLSKNLLPVVIEEQPRIFYKKDEESSEFDAVFTLMVDCSASMHQKMAETKQGIVLFHEVLKQLKIPHQIIGFWEEATTFAEEQPNYFHSIHSFNDSLYEMNGPKIMQLSPQEDNRDGFSIRVVTEKVLERHERDKFLLVFSDGEPAATNYEQNGIIDTYLAVSEARKKGIHVLGMYLAEGEITEQEDMLMKNIYGRERLMISNVAELPELFTPLLQKLLLRTL